MKKGLIFLLTISMYGVTAQTPQTDNNWIINNTFSDEFNSNRKNIWSSLIGTHSGSSLFRSQNIQYGTENGRSFIRFIGEMVNGTPYTGGIRTGLGCGYSGLGYGYYEIEARLLQTSNIVSGLWPAFWTIHSKKDYPPPYWYEEIDIFEPANGQVRENKHHVTYWYNPTTNNPDTSGRIEADKYNVNMSQWHKYAVEWLPGRLTWYLDDEAFFVIGNGQPTPYHLNTNLLIDLQTDKPDGCPPSIYNGLLGYYDVNYFRYYKLNCGTVVITETQGNGYNFNNYTYEIKKSCIFKNTSIPIGAKISIRATDFIELKENFEVPIGAELYLDINPCE